MKKTARFPFAARTARMSASVIREILKISSKPGMISFAGGLPPANAFPLREFERALSDAVRLDGAPALQYAVTEGYAPLKEYLCRWLRKQGLKPAPEDMIFTHGSQHALDLLGKIFLNPGDPVVVEDPTYLGAIQCFNTHEARYVTVPIDAEGLRPEALRKALRSKPRPKLIYVVPTFQNPAGITMSVKRRRLLIAEARRANVPIVEDDPYGLLRFKGRAVPSLYALAKGRGVIYVSTFSKLLSPGIRLGFVLAEPEIMKRIVMAKQASDLQTNTLIQHAVHHYCRRGFLEKHLPVIIRDYKRRAGVMMRAIRAHFPKEVRVYEPEGGMFVWCELPKGLRSADVFRASVEKGVAFVDGSVFYANGGGENTMRLNFTNSSDENITEGVRRLGAVIRRVLKTNG